MKNFDNINKDPKLNRAIDIEGDNLGDLTMERENQGELKMDRKIRLADQHTTLNNVIEDNGKLLDEMSLRPNREENIKIMRKNKFYPDNNVFSKDIDHEQWPYTQKSYETPISNRGIKCKYTKMRGEGASLLHFNEN